MAAATQIGKVLLRLEDTSTQMGKVEKKLAKLHEETTGKLRRKMEDATKKMEEAMQKHLTVASETANQRME